MTVELGIIEGFYGPLWTWSERRQLVNTLLHGFFDATLRIIGDEEHIGL